jgi:hypothetical protein
MEREGTMRRVFSLLLAVVLLAGVGYAVYTSVRERGGGGADDLAVVRGVIGSEKLPFFADPEVAAAFARHGLRLQVDPAGSRAIATVPQLDQYDFGFPAGVPAAERIRRDRKVSKTYQPFSTPMAIATFKPIADILRANGVAAPLERGYWRFDMDAYLDLVAGNRRWNQLEASDGYDSSKSVLITSTDVRTSNSAAMYLAIASYVLNGDSILESSAQADKALGEVVPLFLRQGLSGTSSEEPFEDYLAIGMGKTPMVMVYEAQFLARAAAKDGAIRPDMVLMYPTPTVVTKHTLVPLTPNGDRVGQLLTTDGDLKRLAAKYGFRTSDVGSVDRLLAEKGVEPPPSLVDVVEPPTYEVLEHLIKGIERRYGL